MVGIQPVEPEVEPAPVEEPGEIAQDEINNWVCRPRPRYIDWSQ
jgi:hypothetical protein